VRRDGRGRLFTLQDIEMMISSPPALDEQRSRAGRKSWIRKKRC
jgi:hypothetical protein